MKLKILTILGTRPEIIRLSQIIKKLDLNFNHILVHTGQNYNFELDSIFFKELGIKKPKYKLNKKYSTPIEFISNALLEVDNILLKEKPDAVLVLGDTNSALTVICAKKKQIPIFHLEAGNRCFDKRVPEEINRKIVDHIADMNLTYSDYASKNLILEGLHQNTVIKIGSPLLEVYNKYSSNIDSSKILEKLELLPKKFILASIHREENVDYKETLLSILNALINLKKKLKVKIIFSSHPRTLKNIKKFNIKIKNNDIIFFKPFGFFDYVKLMKNSKLVMSDSGSITEETSILSIPSLNIRNSNERQEGMEYGTVIMTGTKIKNILNSAEILLNKLYKKDFVKNIYPDYSMDDVSEKVVTIIQSYADYLKKI
jgi:UDP-N-acetylglucosamine 2-epimerase (non-hydrolysing)